MLRGQVPLNDMIHASGDTAGYFNMKTLAFRLFGAWQLMPEYQYDSCYFKEDAKILIAYLQSAEVNHDDSSSSTSRLPVCLVGGVDSLHAMTAALDSGFACVAIARPLLREPNFLIKLQHEQE